MKVGPSGIPFDNAKNINKTKIGPLIDVKRFDLAKVIASSMVSIASYRAQHDLY